MPFYHSRSLTFLGFQFFISELGKMMVLYWLLTQSWIITLLVLGNQRKIYMIYYHLLIEHLKVLKYLWIHYSSVFTIAIVWRSSIIFLLYLKTDTRISGNTNCLCFNWVSFHYIIKKVSFKNKIINNKKMLNM